MRAADVGSLYAGLLLNVVIAAGAGSTYAAIYNPCEWAISVLVCGAVLVALCFYPAARLGLDFNADLADATCLNLGPAAGMLVRRALIPLWAVAAFYWIGSDALGLLTTALHSDLAEPALGIRIFVGLFVCLIVTPGVKNSPAELACSSVLWTEVSFFVLVSFALSSAVGWSSAPQFRWQPMHLYHWLLPDLLFWVAPSLLLCGAFYRDLNSGQKAALLPTGLAIVAALAIALSAGVITMGGAAQSSVHFAKVPDLYRFASLQHRDLGWGKLLILSLTTITSLQFLAHVFVRSFWPNPGWLPSAGGSAVLIFLLFLPLPLRASLRLTLGSGFLLLAALLALVSCRKLRHV